MSSKFRIFFIGILFILPIFTSQVDLVYAAKKAQKKSSATPGPIQASLVVDGKTGKVLHADNANAKIYPASLTKVMTLYVLFESLESGKLSLSDELYVSKNATKSLPSKLYLKPGERITVRDAILGLIVRSANDAAVTIAENLAGSEQKFAKLMNIRAKSLGMKSTFFTNASGWHDPLQMSTAVDLAKLSIAIRRDFPQYYVFFSKTSFNFKGKHINGHNPLTATYPGAEGLKTGFHNPAGRNLITVATRNGITLVGVVTGTRSRTHRDTKMASLLDEHFGVSKKPVAPVAKKKGKSSRVKLASGK